MFFHFIYDSENVDSSLLGDGVRVPNLDIDIVNKICQLTGLSYNHGKNKNDIGIAPIDVMDYVYAILFSSEYRNKYKELLKIDFPRIPYPNDKISFLKLVNHGAELRRIHLLESNIISDEFANFPINGDGLVSSKITAKDWSLYGDDNRFVRIWINDKQYFDQIPIVAWDSYIGGYQPARKWLKDRFGKYLTYEDIVHYQKIIGALIETDRVMGDIASIDID